MPYREAELPHYFPTQGLAQVRTFSPPSLSPIVYGYLHSLPTAFALGLFTTTAAALFFHKLLTIGLHAPLSAFFVVVLSPCFFVFDCVTLYLIHRGLSSRRYLYEILSGLACILVILSSASFLSFYKKSNSGLEWTHALEAFPLSVLSLIS
jgi:hypothetical protein